MDEEYRPLEDGEDDVKTRRLWTERLILLQPADRVLQLFSTHGYYIPVGEYKLQGKEN
jgi:hypothetical protein